MAIKINGKSYLSYEEQVLQNKKDIENVIKNEEKISYVESGYIPRNNGHTIGALSEGISIEKIKVLIVCDEDGEFCSLDVDVSMLRIINETEYVSSSYIYEMNIKNEKVTFGVNLLNKEFFIENFDNDNFGVSYVVYLY